MFLWVIRRTREQHTLSGIKASEEWTEVEEGFCEWRLLWRSSSSWANSDNVVWTTSMKISHHCLWSPDNFSRSLGDVLQNSEMVLMLTHRLYWPSVAHWHYSNSPSKEGRDLRFSVMRITWRTQPRCQLTWRRWSCSVFACEFRRVTLISSILPWSSF